MRKKVLFLCLLSATLWGGNLRLAAEATTHCVTTLQDVTDADDGLLSLREAIAGAASGDSITFFLAEGPLVLTLNATLEIPDSSLVIDGHNRNLSCPGKVVIDGGNTFNAGGISQDTGCRLFHVPAEANVTLIDFWLRNGCIQYGNDGDIDGGAIRNAGTLLLKRVTLLDNYAGNGGAICNKEGGKLTVVNSTFSGNRCGGFGGALFSQMNSQALLISCTFTGNRADQGGAVFDNSGFTVNVQPNQFMVNCLLVGNTAEYKDDDTNYDATGLNLFGNAYGLGKITTSQVFSEVEASGTPLMNADGTYHLKPGIATRMGYDVLVEDNVEEVTGRLMIMNPFMMQPFADYTIPTNLTIEEVTEDQRGMSRMFCICRSAGAYQFDDSSFEQSSYDDLYQRTVTTAVDTVDMADGEISFREALAYAQFFGGDERTISFSIHAEPVIQLKAPLEFEKTSNITEIYGHNQDTEYYKPVVLDGGNTKAADGTSCCNGVQLMRISDQEPDGEYQFNLLILNFIMRGGYAKRGGAICVEQPDSAFSGYENKVQFMYVTFTDNCAEQGGALSLAGTNDFDICVFQNNQATVSGGAVEVTGGATTLCNSTFLGNAATDKGGAVYVEGLGHSTSVLAQCTLTDNVASQGGGVYANDSLVLLNTIVAGNLATGEDSIADLYSVESRLLAIHSVYGQANAPIEGSGNVAGVTAGELFSELDNNGKPQLNADDGTLHILPGCPAQTVGAFLYSDDEYNFSYSSTLEGSRVPVFHHFQDTDWSLFDYDGTGYTYSEQTPCVGNYYLPSSYIYTMAAEYGTLCYPFTVNLANGIRAFKVTGVDDNCRLVTEELPDSVPAQTAVLLHGEKGQTLTLPGFRELDFEILAAFVHTGLLVGTHIDLNVPKDKYVLQDHGTEDDGLAFYLVDPLTMVSLNAHRCWLNWSGPGAAPSLRIGSATGLEESNVSTLAEEWQYFDLQGRPVATPVKGQLYLLRNVQTGNGNCMKVEKRVY